MVIQKLIYLDTNLWNKMLDQSVDPTALVSALRQSGASIALSGQTVYELTRTFSATPERAKKLFRHVKAYVDAGIVGAYDNAELLRAEVKALYEDADSVVAYYSPADYAALKEEVGKLAEGLLDERARSFVSGRLALAQATRERQNNLFERRPDMKARLFAVSKDELPGWLDEQVRGDVGAVVLAKHLIHTHSSTDRDAASSTAQGLLTHPASRIAKAIVRADLFWAWRCARRNSNPRDLADDLYHVLNAAYCDVYATADSGQREYASLLLSPWTRPVIYDENTSLTKWLLTV